MIGEIAKINILENFTMQTVGTYLKSSREAKKISLSEISHHTKISKWYLNCLEKDDFANLPGGPYIKAYISSYATFIGIDENEAIKKYDSSNPESELTNQTDTSIGKNSRFKSLTIISKKTWILSLAFFMIILSLAGFFYFIFQRTDDAKLQKTYKNPKQNEYQTSRNQIIELTPEGLKLKQTNSNIQNTAPPKNLEGVANALPEPNINQQATEKISESRAESETLNTKTPPLNTDSVTQGVQIQPNAEDGIKVVKAIASGGIKDRGPIDIGNSFQWSKGKVYIWSMIDCTNPPLSIKHIYYFNEQKVSEVSLVVKSNQWRTWSYKTISDKRYIGQWRVDITSADGKVLETIRFEVN